MISAMFMALLAAAPAPVEPIEVTEVDDVVVTGSRTDRKREESTARVEVIDRAAIEASGAESVAAVLDAHPGIELEPSMRGFSVRMQGLDPDYVLILIDGERAQGRLAGGLDLTRFPAESIERIEIVKGAGSALYGADAVAGVINIITRRPKQDLELGGHFAGGSAGALDATGQLGVRRARYELMGIVGHHRGDGYDLDKSTPDTTASAFKTSDASLSAGVWPTGNLRLGGKAEYSLRRQEGVGTSPPSAVFDRTTQSEQASLTIEPDWRFAGGSRLRVTGHRSYYNDQFLSDQRGSSALDQLQKTVEHLTRGGVQYDLALSPRHQLTSGAEVLHEQIESPRITGGQGTRTRFALFAQHEGRLLDEPRLAVLPGLRFDADSQFGSHVSPKLAVRFDARADLALRAAYGFGYRAPSFQELYLAFDNPAVGYMIAGNPNLQPENSKSANLDLEWQPHTMVQGRLGVFRSDIDNLIITRITNMAAVGVPSVYSYENISSAHTQGLESGVNVEPVKGLSVDLGYTLTLAHDDEADRPLEGRARHRGTVRVGYRHAGIGFSAHARGAAVSRRPFYVDSNQDRVLETEWAKAYATLGLRLAQRIWRKVDVFAGIDNLLDTGDALYLPIPPRRFYGGLDLRY